MVSRLEKMLETNRDTHNMPALLWEYNRGLKVGGIIQS